LPSFFAAATSASIPPKSAALVAFEASTDAPPAELFAAVAAPLVGALDLLDEQAAALKASSAAAAAMPVRRRFKVFLQSVAAGGRPHATYR